MARFNPRAEPLTMIAYLDGDIRMSIGVITLTDDKTIDDFATAAYRQAQGSLKRLMQPKWRLVIVDQCGVEHGFGLEKWNKLVDGEEVEKQKREVFLRAREKAAK